MEFKKDVEGIEIFEVTMVLFKRGWSSTVF